MFCTYCNCNSNLENYKDTETEYNYTKYPSVPHLRNFLEELKNRRKNNSLLYDNHKIMKKNVCKILENEDAVNMLKSAFKCSAEKDDKKDEKDEKKKKDDKKESKKESENYYYYNIPYLNNCCGRRY